MAPTKSGVLTPEEQRQHDDIIQKKPLQIEQYRRYLEHLGKEGQEKIEQRYQALGFVVDFETGQIQYDKDFKPVDISYDLWFVRHGKTEGNTEPRVFQGQVDYENNQLNAVGLQQAEEAAEKMDKEVKESGWVPDLIAYSPLGRTKQTSEPFHRRYPEIPIMEYEPITEMGFGEWDNLRVIDVPHDSIAHLLYLDQNTLIRAPKPHIVNTAGDQSGQQSQRVIPSESFLDVLERASDALLGIKIVQPNKHGKGKVLMFSHSMVGAAISMLLGHGKTIEGSNGRLGFSAKYRIPNATPVFLPPQYPSY